MKKKITTLFILGILIISVVSCSNSNRISLESYINMDRAMDTIEELTMAKYAGRLTGTQGNTLAVDYIAEQFSAMGLDDHERLIDYRQPYEQKVILTEATPELYIVQPSGEIVKRFQYLSDFKILTFWPGIRIEGTVQGEIVVISGEAWLDDGQDYRDMVLVIDKSVLRGEHPDGPYEILDKIFKCELKIKGVVFNLDNKNNDLYDVKPNIYHVATARGQAQFNNEDGPFVGYCTQDVFDELQAASHDNLELAISAHYTYKDETVANVIGIIPGVHEELKDDVLIIGAHLDHAGENKDGTYQPGALDNASGIAAMLEIAGTLRDAGISPKKTIVFIAFNGEEMGLFGSTYYIRNPLFPQYKTILINLDMVGSKKAVPLIISSDLEQLKNEIFEFALAMGIDCECEMGLPSDQIPFTLRNVEAVTLIHNDQTHVHTPKDTLENIDRDRLEEVIRLVIGFTEKTAY